MKNRYEVLLALSRGQGRIRQRNHRPPRKTFEAEGAAIEQVQRFEKRDLAYELTISSARIS